jgi:hypothetical protein
MRHWVPATVVIPHTSILVTQHIANNTGTKLFGPYATQSVAECVANTIRIKADPNYVYPRQPKQTCTTPRPKKVEPNTTPLAGNKRMRAIKRGY